ncbi:MAG: DedA family protein [Bacteroidia bacterium]|nr:DedA family protein [Bacteroidia bacterium]
MGFTEFLIENILRFFEAAGYWSVMILMALESMVAPVPSEAVMPPAGFLIARGTFTFTGVIFFSTLGSIIGSLISYYIGALGGRPLVERFGKYLLLDKKALDASEKFFKKRGDITIFICRFIPVIRHLISIPAGIARMRLIKFIIYTIIGAGIWNSFLAFVGYKLQDNWDSIVKWKYRSWIDIAVLLVLFLVSVYYAYKLYKNFRKEKTQKQ